MEAGYGFKPGDEALSCGIEIRRYPETKKAGVSTPAFRIQIGVETSAISRRSLPA